VITTMTHKLSNILAYPIGMVAGIGSIYLIEFFLGRSLRANEILWIVFLIIVGAVLLSWIYEKI